ncbi:MAG: MFS transporter [Candidatus Solibacter sp.]|nr:MFS transporter [Candidatus Solibacter sp.]
MTPQQQRASAIRFIVCLGVVSLFADMTYEGARSSIGPFLKDLGASATQVGLIAGFGEMLAASLRLFSGRFADRTHAYWTITICGYAMNLIAVPLLAFAGNWQMAAFLVIVERTGKALGHGWGFGLHAALDQTGAVLGPLLMAVAVARSDQFGPAFLRLGIPAILALAALLTARAAYPTRGLPPGPKAPQALPRFVWMYVAAAGLLACGFVDFALLGYHFQKTGLARPAMIPLWYSGAMAVNGITALVFGRLFDRYGLPVLTCGILVSLLALPLGFLGGESAAIAGVACWATGMGAQDASLRAGIAQVVSMNQRGSAFGAFNAVYGVAWFLGSAVMGLLYDHSLGALVVFGMAAQLSAALLFFRLRKRLAAAGR